MKRSTRLKDWPVSVDDAANGLQFSQNEILPLPPLRRWADWHYRAGVRPLKIVRMDGMGTVASHASAWTDEALSHLMTRRRVAETPNLTAWAIRAATAWLGPEAESAPAGMHRHQADLRLRVSERPDLVTFGKAAFVDFGDILLSEDGWEVEVGWRASTLAPLFPVFSGRIVAHADELTLSGWYAPPFGKLGRVADRVLLHIAATGTARWLLGEIDKAAARSVR